MNEAFQTLALALGLGLLVGLQRERSASVLAGFRTFPLITLFGTVCAWLSVQHGGWILGAGLVALAAAIFSGNIVRARQAESDPGITTTVTNTVNPRMAASRKYPMQFLCDYANAVIDNEIGEIMEYRHLLKDPKHRERWQRSFSKEI